MTDPENGHNEEKRRSKATGEINLKKIRHTFRSDFQSIKEFYLDQETIQRLENMGKLKKFLFFIIWLFRSLFLKLTTFRRFLLIIGLILMFINIPTVIGIYDIAIRMNLKVLGGLIILYLLMLELKDKLLAHDELAAGRSVQIALLPDTNPGIPGWDVWLYSQPANDVGGDLLDYIQLGKNRFGLALGDVSGKGLAAALLMAKLQSTLRALVSEHETLSKLAGKINEIFHRDSMTKSFSSLIYLELISDSGYVKLLNAGHLPPYVLRKDGVENTGKGDIALGIKADYQFRDSQIKIESGDFIIVYSDGVIEAQNEKGDFFGNERLLKILKDMSSKSASEAGENVLNVVENFIGESPQNDDLSIMIVKRL